MANPQIVMSTSKGDIELELYADDAPITTQNILNYVDKNFYDNTIFHRVIPGFMIQGGGFTPDMQQKDTDPPIKNEAANGRQNKRGTAAMARTSVVDSASSQFFINLTDNTFLNFKGPSPDTYGYCVFGEVTDGMDVVDEIAKVKTGQSGPHGDVPVEPVIIYSVRRKQA